MQTEIARETRKFFDLRLKLKSEIESIEKDIYERTKFLDGALETFRDLQTISEKLDSPYFEIRLRKLEILLLRLKDSKKYKKMEFDRIFSVIEKIKQSDSVEFLNEALKNKIEKIAESHIKIKDHIEKSPETKDQTYLFNYAGVNFVTRGFPRKIVYDVDADKNFVRISEKRYPIFPKTSLNPLQTEEEMILKSTNLLILKLKKTYCCFRFDYFDIISEMNYEDLKRKLRKLDEPISGIEKYMNWKDKRYYYLDPEILTGR
jgi:hypothetical protein